MTRRPLAALGAVAAALAIAACGGDELSADEYAAELDASCATFAQNLEEVPRVQQEEGLSIEEAQELAVQYGDDFEAEVEGLEAPSELEDSAQALQETLASPPPAESPDPEEFLTYYEELRDLYEELGADDCVTVQEDAIAALEENAKGGLFDTAAPAG